MGLFESRTISGGGDDRWLKSRDGVNVAQTGTLDLDSFDGTYVASGTPVELADDVYVPYAGDAATLRFVLGNQDKADGGTVPLVFRGYISVEHLPVSFDAPSGTQFTFDPAAPVVAGGSSGDGGAV